jgi:TPR repeat protein
LRQNQESFSTLKHYRPFCFTEDSKINSRTKRNQRLRATLFAIASPRAGLIALALIGGNFHTPALWAQTNPPAADTAPSVQDQLGNGAAAYDKQNFGEAFRWYSQAAAQGDPSAQFKVGIMYLNGQGVTQSNDQAIAWLTKSATQGFVLAQALLGNMYLSGQQIPKDYAKAMAWLTKAADQGNADAEAYLGYMYKDGLGVQPDRNAAIGWFKKAATQGDADSQKELRKLQGQAQAPHPSRKDIPDALVFRCQLESSRSIGQALKSETDSDVQAAHKAYEACLRSNWRRLFGDTPFPEN